jgi:hypothetical protein
MSDGEYRWTADYASRRWARAVIAMLGEVEDPRTLGHWARAAGSTEGGLRALSRMVQLPAKASLDFGRLLRIVVVGAHEERWVPANLLDVQDGRTLVRLLALGGLTKAAAAGRPPAVPEFLGAQRLVTGTANLRAVRLELDAFEARALLVARHVAAGAAAGHTER